ncbi:unnamed protein product [Chrysodeixis includens]|uniref:gamma-glutamylcyclotransferase n=1 Tax=Chrysodeixis includens TaxID=689277 RepID=A0A9P0BM18_CHRIL|nr:unnamed protein product [Chrysodeixis includens]
MFDREPVRSLVRAVHSRNMQSIIFSFICATLIQIICSASDLPGKANDTFFYFAYGSNLLAKRLLLRNPSAVFYSTARLDGHRLDFNQISETWNGAVATIVEDEDEDVVGILWTLNMDQQHLLDEQEGVELGWYFPKNVTVTTPYGKKVVARTYEEVEETPKIDKGTLRPPDRTPSSTYLEVILLGAIEAGLPPDYIAFLISFPTNGRMAHIEIRRQLGYPFHVM